MVIFRPYRYVIVKVSISDIILRVGLNYQSCFHKVRVNKMFIYRYLLYYNERAVLQAN
jgi:hypothetical protein